MSNDIQVKFTVRADGVSERIKAIRASIAGVRDTAEKLNTTLKKQDKVVKDWGKQFKAEAMAIAKGFAGVTAAIFAAKKLMDFGREGANVLRMERSFSRLNISMDDLHRAAGGTIDDMTLMASSAKLVAGVSGELADEMARAAPELIKIARAAVQLDPTIGSVAEVYEALAKGIKKSQPLLIDNANIAVKVGDANARMAESLGKSVSELTAEEKSLALLNETLRAGGNLIEQVGGIADDQATSFERLDASWGNYTDDVKKDGAVLSNVAGFMSDVLDASVAVREDIPKWVYALGPLGAAYIEWQIAAKMANNETEKMQYFVGAATLELVRFGVEINEAADGANELTDNTALLAAQGAKMTTSLRDMDARYSTVNEKLEKAISVYGKNSKEVAALRAELKKLDDASATSAAQWALDAMKRAGATSAELLEFQRASGLITDDAADMIEAQDALQRAWDEGRISTAEYAVMVRRLHDNIKKMDGLSAESFVTVYIRSIRGYGGQALRGGGGYEGNSLKGSSLENFLTGGSEYTFEAGGGQLNNSGWTLVGDAPGGVFTPYSELVSPSGMVYSNAESRVIMQSGLIKPASRYIGGILESEGDYGGGISMVSVLGATAATSSVSSRPSRRTKPAATYTTTTSGGGGSQQSEVTQTVSDLSNTVASLATQATVIGAAATTAQVRSGRAIELQQAQISASNAKLVDRLDRLVGINSQLATRSDIANAMRDAMQEALAGSI